MNEDAYNTGCTDSRRELERDADYRHLIQSDTVGVQQNEEEIEIMYEKSKAELAAELFSCTRFVQRSYRAQK